MRRFLIGLVFLLGAAWILLQGYFGIPLFTFNVWPLVIGLGFAAWALNSLLERQWIWALILAWISFAIINGAYDLLDIDNGTVFSAGLLATIGIGIMVGGKKCPDWQKSVAKEYHSSSEVNFGSKTHYISGSDFSGEVLEVNFGKLKVFFDPVDDGLVSGDLTIEVNFGYAELYVPREWRVQSDVAAAFGATSIEEAPLATSKVLRLHGDVNFGYLKVVYR